MVKSKYTITQYMSGIGVPLLVLLAGLAAYFLILPKFSALRAAREELAAKRADVQSRQGQLSTVKQLAADYETKKNRLGPIDEALPDAPRIPELLANIDALAKQSGLLVSSLQITPVSINVKPGETQGALPERTRLLLSAENLGVLEIDLGLKGKYPNVKAFLANLEQNLRLMDTDNINFGLVEIESGLQEYNLQIQTYYQK